MYLLFPRKSNSFVLKICIIRELLHEFKSGEMKYISSDAIIAKINEGVEVTERFVFFYIPHLSVFKIH